MQNKFYHYLFSILLISATVGTKAFADASAWLKINESDVKGTATRYIKPTKAQFFQLNLTEMKAEFAGCPKEKVGKIKNYGKIISIPMPDGSFQRFAFAKYDAMEPELAIKWSFISTFTGQGIDDPTAICKADFTSLGFHSMILREAGSVFIDPVLHGSDLYYQVYNKADLNRADKGKFIEYDLDGHEDEALFNKSGSGNTATLATGGTRREYRVAIAATAEYTTFQGGAANAASAMTTTLNRVNGMYEKEVCIRLNLVANNNVLIYTVASTDPYTNGNASTMLTQNQNNITTVIGTANFDIGHVFGTNSGGIAGFGVVCSAGNKARGVTGSSTPVGDPFDIDYVAHEMGHQFGGSHTFNSVSGSCGGNNREATRAFEPGSGTTIMAYAGICGNDDLQNNSNDYFNFTSYEQIVAYSVGGGNSCAVKITTGNNPPVIPVITGGYVLPISTPFKLTSTTATDPDGDAITYCWEEFDLGAGGAPGSPVGDAPIFRSFTPVSSPIRIFPKLSTVISGTSVIGERLPTYARNLKFKMTARDNVAGTGGVNSTSINMTVVASAGPFAITVPNVNTISWEAGTTQTVTWSVANTHVAPVNSPIVRIKLSTDGGQTYPYILKDSTNNDGSQSVVLPFVTSNTARIMVESYSNVFFDISNASFKITAPTTANIAFATSSTSVCPGQTFKVGFVPTGTTYLPGNVFSLQLSSSTGQFTTPTNIGSKQATDADTILATIPLSQVAGTGYKMRIISSNPVRTSVLELPAPEIRTLAPQPGNMSGLFAFCAGATNVLYSVPVLANVLGYQWTVPAGSTIVSNPDSNAVFVNLGSTGGTIAVSSINGCGAGVASTLNLQPIVVLPSQATLNITSSTICESAVVQFTTQLVNAGQTPTYVWLKNGVVIPGADSANYSGTGFVTGDQISMVLNSSLSCGEPNTDTSNVITLTVTPKETPVATITSTVNDTLCTGGSVTLTAQVSSGGTNPAYQWFKNTSQIPGANQSFFLATNLITGDSIRVRLTSNSTCVTTSTVFSNAKRFKVLVLVAAAGADTALCSGDGSVTCIGLPVGGTWSGTGVSPAGLFNSQIANAYPLIYTINKYGCIKTDTKIITVKALPVFSLGADLSVCKNVAPFVPNGQTGIICSGTGFSGGVFNPAVAGPGAFEIICSKTLIGCTTRDSVTITVNPVDSAFYSVAGNTLTAGNTGVTGYQWFLGNNPIAGATSVSFTITANGVYCVEITQANGCKSKSICQNQVFTGIEDDISADAFQLYPNPAEDVIFINTGMETGKNIQVQIFNTLGQNVLSMNKVTNEEPISISTRIMASGFYTVILRGENSKMLKTKFLKK